MRDYRIIGVPGALLGVLAGFPAVSFGQEQSTPANQTTLEEVVVTGTSIRGVAPVGSNLITVGRAEIEASGAQTLAQVLRSVPAVTGFGSSGAGAVGQGGGGAGGFQSFDGAGSYTPTIHGLGASASNGTLILIDGHRLPLSGINHTLADPSVIAPLAIERVEILPDGASAVYGSDAVAGVLNFITRRKYNGFEGSLQASFGDGYDTQSAGFITGLSGELGSAMFTYNYSTRGNLTGGERPYTAANHIPQGGGNFANFNCAPASVSPATGQPGAGLIFAYPVQRRRHCQCRGEQLLRLLVARGHHSRGRSPQPDAQARARGQRLAHPDRRLHLRAPAQRDSHQSRLGDRHGIRTGQRTGGRGGADQPVLRRSGWRQ